MSAGPSNPSDTDKIVAIADSLLSMGETLYPKLILLKPLLLYVLRRELDHFQSGLADGSIIADGRGGWVPATNSRVDPTTGRFL